jgi:DNA-binding protein H-NS
MSEKELSEDELSEEALAELEGLAETELQEESDSSEEEAKPLTKAAEIASKFKKKADAAAAASKEAEDLYDKYLSEIRNEYFSKLDALAKEFEAQANKAGIPIHHALSRISRIAPGVLTAEDEIKDILQKQAEEYLTAIGAGLYFTVKSKESPSSAPSKPATPAPAAPTKPARAPIKPKYFNPEDYSETWSGIGSRTPKWTHKYLTSVPGARPRTYSDEINIVIQTKAGVYKPPV